MNWREARASMVRPSPAGLRRLCERLEELRGEWELKPEAMRDDCGEYGRLKGLFEAARRFHGEWGRLAIVGVSYGPRGAHREAHREAKTKSMVDVAG